MELDETICTISAYEILIRGHLVNRELTEEEVYACAIEIEKRKQLFLNEIVESVCK